MVECVDVCSPHLGVAKRCVRRLQALKRHRVLVRRPRAAALVRVRRQRLRLVRRADCVVQRFVGRLAHRIRAPHVHVKLAPRRRVLRVRRSQCLLHRLQLLHAVGQLLGVRRQLAALLLHLCAQPGHLRLAFRGFASHALRLLLRRRRAGGGGDLLTHRLQLRHRLEQRGEVLQRFQRFGLRRALGHQNLRHARLEAARIRQAARIAAASARQGERAARASGFRGCVRTRAARTCRARARKSRRMTSPGPRSMAARRWFRGRAPPAQRAPTPLVAAPQSPSLRPRRTPRHPAPPLPAPWRPCARGALSSAAPAPARAQEATRLWGARWRAPPAGGARLVVAALPAHQRHHGQGRVRRAAPPLPLPPRMPTR